MLYISVKIIIRQVMSIHSISRGHEETKTLHSSAARLTAQRVSIVSRVHRLCSLPLRSTHPHDALPIHHGRIIRCAAVLGAIAREPPFAPRPTPRSYCPHPSFKFSLPYAFERKTALIPRGTRRDPPSEGLLLRSPARATQRHHHRLRRERAPKIRGAGVSL